MGPICSLVLAHQSPNHLTRLLRTLTVHGDTAVVHLDRRVDPADFAEALATPGVTLVQNRVEVVWGGWSIVEATLRALRTGLTTSPDASHYQLMSGDSFPLRPMPEVRRRYQDSGDTNFLDLTPFPQPHKPAYRIRNYYIEHDPWGHPMSLVFRAANRAMRRPTIALGGRTLYSGSQWWTLTSQASRWLVGAVDHSPKLVRFMRHTRVPDEHFVQILLGNSPLHPTIRPPLFYADWRPGPAGRLPPILTPEHIGDLNGSDSLWARKFPDDSIALLDQLTEQWDEASRSAALGDDERKDRRKIA